MTDVAVIDYGMGNLHSVAKAIERVRPDLEVSITSDPEVVKGARRVVFPGQGAMPDCVREMDGRGLRAAVLEAAQAKPFLGICIGLQMLFDRSEEGDTPGFGLLPGRGSHRLLANCLRVTVGAPDENAAFLSALTQALSD